MNLTKISELYDPITEEKYCKFEVAQSDFYFNHSDGIKYIVNDGNRNWNGLVTVFFREMDSLNGFYEKNKNLFTIENINNSKDFKSMYILYLKDVKVTNTLESLIDNIDSNLIPLLNEYKFSSYDQFEQYALKYLYDNNEIETEYEVYLQEGEYHSSHELLDISEFIGTYFFATKIMDSDVSWLRYERINRLRKFYNEKKLKDVKNYINNESHSVIVLDGKWGSGKSVLTSKLILDLKDENKYEIKYIDISSNISFYKNNVIFILDLFENYILNNIDYKKTNVKDFIKFMVENLPLLVIDFIPNETIKSIAKNTLKLIKCIKNKRPIDDLVKNYTEERDLSLGIISQFMYLCSTNNKKLIVAIDELDRIPPEKVIDILNLIKYVDGIANNQGIKIIFILPSNIEILSNSLEHIYGKFGSESYFERFISTVITVPSIDSDVVVDNILNFEVNKNIDVDIVDINEYDMVLIEGYSQNPFFELNEVKFEDKKLFGEHGQNRSKIINSNSDLGIIARNYLSLITVRSFALSYLQKDLGFMKKFQNLSIRESEKYAVELYNTMKKLLDAGYLHKYDLNVVMLIVFIKIENYFLYTELIDLSRKMEMYSFPSFDVSARLEDESFVFDDNTNVFFDLDTLDDDIYKYTNLFNVLAFRSISNECSRLNQIKYSNGVEERYKNYFLVQTITYLNRNAMI